MVRMTDLLKKAKSKEERFTPERKAQEKLPPVKKERPPIPKKGPPVTKKKPIKPTKSKEERKIPAEEPVKFAELVLGPAKEPPAEREAVTEEFMRVSIPDEEETKKIYFMAIESMKKIYTTYKKDGGTINKEDITNIGQKIVNNIIMGSRMLLRLFHELDSPEDYFYYNVVNVSILAVELGLVYKYNKSTLLDLAVIGLLHDMDLVKSKDIIDKPRKLDKKELKQIRKHPLNTATYVDNAFNFSKEIANAILQHHERRDGQGYPAGLTDRDIQDLAVIIGIADTYEAMTHSRPYKEKMSSHSAIMNIINFGKELFTNEAIKALVTCVGLYPIGSWIELNTGEICRVLMTNPETPLRPVISILMDKDRNKFKEVRTIDLQKTPSLYIKNIIKKGIT